jgi:hypothetical protein
MMKKYWRAMIMVDGISRPYSPEGRKKHDEIFNNKKDVIDRIPLKIKKEIKKLNATEARLERRRLERYKPISIEEHNLKNKIEDDRQKF